MHKKGFVKHFHEVFHLIKKNCSDTGTIDGQKCLEVVKEHLQTDEEYKLSHLIDHLTILQNLGLITYKGSQDIGISLTELGMKTEKIPLYNNY